MDAPLDRVAVPALVQKEVTTGHPALLLNQEQIVKESEHQVRVDTNDDGILDTVSNLPSPSPTHLIPSPTSAAATVQPTMSNQLTPTNNGQLFSHSSTTSLTLSSSVHSSSSVSIQGPSSAGQSDSQCSSCANSPPQNTSSSAPPVTRPSIEPAADDHREPELDESINQSIGEDDEDDEESDPSELFDDIAQAMTKTALSTILFAFTRSNRVPLNYVNTLSKAMCNSSATLREFDLLRTEAEAMELAVAAKEAEYQQQLAKQKPVKRSLFFGLRSKPKPLQPSPLQLVKNQTDEMMWNWVRSKMEDLMAQQQLKDQKRGQAGNFSHLPSSATFSIGSSSSTTRPISISSTHAIPSALTQQLHSSNHANGSNVLGTSVPVSRPPPSVVHSSSFAHYPDQPTSQPSLSGHPIQSAISTTNGVGVNENTKYSPRKLWRTLFYSGAVSVQPSLENITPNSSGTTPITSSATSTPLVISPNAGLVQSSHVQHFDSFPKLDDILIGLIRTPLPQSALDWLGGRIQLSSEAITAGLSTSSQHTPLVLHANFPFPIPTPFNALALTEEELTTELHVYSSWNDVLLNYRKHIPKRAGSPPSVLLNWWLEMWHKVEIGSWLDDISMNQPSSTVLSSSLPVSHTILSMPPSIQLPSDSFATFHLRLLVLLRHWIFLTPFDFINDTPSAERIRHHLALVLSKYSNVKQSLRPLDQFTEPTSHPLKEFVQSLMDTFQDPETCSPLTSKPTPSPLTIVPYPFSDEMDNIYSSNLFSYPPVQLARELMLHSYDLFRRIPLTEWLDGAWQQKGGQERIETYTNAYSQATGMTIEDPTVAIPPTQTSRFINDFNRLVYWISTEILHPRLSPAQRQDLVLYFLELGIVSLKVHRNFHVTFAVAAAFSAQPLYRLKEIQNLANMDAVYANESLGVQRLVESELTPSSSPTTGTPNPTGSPSSKSRRHHVKVRTQYEELKAVTSSRNNYATYRNLLANILGDETTTYNTSTNPSADPPSTMRRVTSETSLSGMTPYGGASLSGASSGVSTPRLWSTSLTTSRSTSDVTSPIPPTIAFPSAQCSFDSTLEFPDPIMANLTPTSTGSDLPPLTLAPPLTLIPHLAVHLKDLTYSQELSGVELQWMDEPNSTDSTAAASTLSTRFDRSRWRRTTRLICNLLRFQRLPIFPTLLQSHSSPLYTLLQVHLFTHVLPESELLKLSLEICPRIDRTKVKQVQQGKKTLTALQEEGFI